MAKPTILWGQSYRTQVKARQVFNSWWKALRRGFYFSTHPEFDKFMWLAEHHPDAKQKLAKPVFAFKITDDFFGNKTTRIVWDDNSEVDISLPACLKTRSEKQDLREAMRLAVMNQTQEFLKRDPRCAACGSEVNLEVHHLGVIGGFEELCRIYTGSMADLMRLSLREWCGEDLEIMGSAGGLWKPRKFRDDPNTNMPDFLDEPWDQAFKRGWQLYHLRFAELQVLCKPCHVDAARLEKILK